MSRWYTRRTAQFEMAMATRNSRGKELALNVLDMHRLDLAPFRFI